MSKARIFFGTEKETFQILSISQNRNDGSIYLTAPDFENMNWLVPAVAENRQTVLLAYQALAPGKLSLHGSGIAHVRPYESLRPNQLSIVGNLLRSENGEMVSARHLMTVFLPEPKHRPNSPAMARKSDYVISGKSIHPLVIVFWAIPAQVPVTVALKCSFRIEELEEVPPNSGWGSFRLATHAIVWFAYRTKHMDRWPEEAQACFSDGYTVPLFIGTGPGEFRLEFRQPTYTQNRDQVEIVL